MPHAHFLKSVLGLLLQLGFTFERFMSARFSHFLCAFYICHSAQCREETGNLRLELIEKIIPKRIEAIFNF